MAYVNINVLAKRALEEEERKKQRAAQTQQSRPDMRSRTVTMNRERADKDSTYAPAGVSRELYDAVREGRYTSAIDNTPSRSNTPTPLPVFKKPSSEPSVSPSPTRTAAPRAGGDMQTRIPIKQEKTWMEDVAERKAKFADSLTVQTDAERALGLPGTKSVTLRDYAANPNIETYTAFDRATTFRQPAEEAARKLNVPLKMADGNDFGYISEEAYNAIANNKLDSYTPISKSEKEAILGFKEYALEMLSKQQIAEKEKRIQSNPIFARYNIDPDNFDLFDFDEWAKKHNYQEMTNGDGTYYTPKYEGGILGVGGKKLTSKQEEKDFKVLLALAQNNSRKTATDKDYGSAMAALLGFGDNFLFGVVPFLAEQKVKREYESAGLSSNSFVGQKQMQQKTQSEHPVASFMGNVSGDLATVLPLGKFVSAGVKSTKLLAKAPLWIQQAVTDGITFGISNGTKTAFQGGTVEEVLKSAARGGTSAAAGGALSAKADQLITSLLTNPKYADKFWGQIKNLRRTNVAKNVTVGLVDAIGDNVADATMAWATGTESRSAEDILADFAVTLIYGLVNTAVKTKEITQSNRSYIENELARYMNDYNALSIASKTTRSLDEFVELGEAIILRGKNLREFLQRNIFTGQKNLVDSITEKLDYINEAVGRKIDNVSRKTKTQTTTPQLLPQSTTQVQELPVLSSEAKILPTPAKGVFDKNIGTKSNFATQADVDNYIDYAYRYAEEQNVKGNKGFPKQKDSIVIGKTSERLVSDLNSEYGIDVSNAIHAIRDNDIRHIKNSHGEDTNEKYPVTADDLKRIPDIVENYDDVLYVEKTDGKRGLYFVKRHNGVTYYLENISDDGLVLQNKQMIKVSTGTIPDVEGLYEAINKKWNIDSSPDDASIPRMYVQDVPNNVPTITIPQPEQSVKREVTELPVLQNETQVQELPVVSGESFDNGSTHNNERLVRKGAVYKTLVDNLLKRAEDLGLSIGNAKKVLASVDFNNLARSDVSTVNNILKDVYANVDDADARGWLYGAYNIFIDENNFEARTNEVVELPVVQNEMQSQASLVAKNEAQLNQGNEGVAENDYADTELTYEERDAILRYKSSESYKINEKLYSGQELNEQEAKLVADVNSALDKRPVYQGKVYRNLSFDLKGQEAFDNFIRMHKKGGFVSYPAFTSTSKTPDGYVVDGELLAHIELYSVSGRDIENIGDKVEKEVLFKTDPLFIVKDVQFDGKVVNIILEEDGYDRIREGYVLQHSGERGATVRNVQKSHTDDIHMQSVSEENTGRNNAWQVGPQGALPGGQRDTVRTRGSELRSGSAVRQEQDRIIVDSNSSIDDELAQALREDDEKLAVILTEKGVAYTKDFARNFDAMSGGNKKVRNWLAMLFESPFLDAKALYSTELKETLLKYYDGMKRLGIKKGSKESAAVQWYGEGVRMDQYGELHDYTLADLKREFPQTWENIVAADLINRELYDGYIDQINAVLEQIYPYIMENAQYDLEFHQHEADMLRRQLDELRKENSNVEDVGGNSAIAEIDSNINAKQAEYDSLKRKDTRRAAELLTQIERMKNRRDKLAADSAIRKSKIERSRFLLQRSIEVLEHKIAQHEAEAARLEEGIRTGSIMKNKRLNKRKDYYHHFKEMSEGFMGLGNIFDVGHAIDTELVGTSDNTKPRTKWEGFMQRRLEGRYSADSVAGMLHYIPAALYKIHFDPVIAQNRRNIDMLKQATGDTKNANGAIEWLVDWTNGLAGKTNPIDRPVQKIVGRRAMKIVAWLNSRFKKNAIFGNLRTAISQFLNLPNGIAYVKNPRDLAKGVRRYIKNIFSKDSVIDDSAFMRERYIESEFDKFDEGVLKVPEKFAKWMLTFGDKETAKLIWYSAYEQSMRKNNNHSDAVVYADDVTRRSIAGRGIGELPLTLESKFINLIAPFQVEANNVFQMIKEKIGENDVAGLAIFAFSSWVLNNIIEALGLGRILPDVVDALAESVEEFGDKEKDLKTKFGEGFTRLTGELLSYSPFGTVASGFLPEDFRKLFYGENDPTRYGTGNAGIAALAEPVADVLENGVSALPQAAWDISTDLLMPWGGTQLDRTIDAAHDFGVLPVFGERNAAPASYTDDGRLRYSIEPNVTNTIKAFAFGSSATKEGNEYFNSGPSPMSHEQTEVFKSLTEDGVSGTDAFDLLKSLDNIDENSDKTKAFQAREKVRDASYLNKYQKSYVDSALIPGKYADYTDVDTFALSVAFPDESKRKKAYQIASTGLPAQRVMDIMDKLDKVKSDTDDWGRSVSGSKNKNSVEYIESLGLKSNQKAAIYKAYVFNDVDDRYNFLANELGITDDVLGDIYGKLSTIESSKNNQGKTISGSQNRNVYNYINTLSLSGEQRRLLFAWFASSTNEQKKQRYNVVDNLNISQGDKNVVLQWLQGNKTITDAHIRKIFNRQKK